MFYGKSLVFLITGVFAASITAQPSQIKSCGIRCPSVHIPPECVMKDFIIFDDEFCQTCDINSCLLTKWPPDVSVPYCPMTNCNSTSIPDNCVIRQFRKINRRRICRACDADVCNPSKPTEPPVTNELVPLCPKLRCKIWGIPKECLLPSYDVVNGIRCRKCDEDACRHPPALRSKAKRRSSY